MIAIILLALAALLLSFVPFTTGPGQRILCVIIAALALFVLLSNVVRF